VDGHGLPGEGGEWPDGIILVLALVFAYMFLVGLYEAPQSDRRLISVTVCLFGAVDGDLSQRLGQNSYAQIGLRGARALAQRKPFMIFDRHAGTRARKGGHREPRRHGRRHCASAPS